MDCIGKYLTHVQRCENFRVQSATESSASVHNLHMPKAVITCSKCYGMGCFGTYLMHAQRRENLCVQSATKRTASVHALHMPKIVMTFVFKELQKILLRYIIYICPNLSFDNVFKVLRHGLLRYILYPCPKAGKPSCSKCYRKFCLDI